MARQADDMFTLDRRFEAPRALVWEAFTRPEHLARWWGPAGLECRVHALDLRPGGHFHFEMRGPRGPEMWGLFEYREVDPPARLVLDNSFSNEAGEVTRAFFSDDYPLRVRNQWDFAEQGSGTLLSIRAWPIEASETEREFYRGMFASMRGGFGGTLDKLDSYLGRMET